MESIHEIIGRCVERNNKRYFDELKEIIGYAEPVLSDLSLLPKLRSLYCELADFPEYRLLSRERDRTATEHRRVFIAILHRIYFPNALNPNLNLSIPRGFNLELSKILRIHQKNIYGFSRNTCFFYGKYEDFTRRVDDLYAKITSTIQAWESTDPK